MSPQKFDLIFDLHQHDAERRGNTFLCESLSFSKSCNFSPIPTEDFLEALSGALERDAEMPRLGRLHLVDMGRHPRRAVHDAIDNGFYNAIELFAKLRCSYPKLSEGVTICGKINLYDLEREAVLFKYWFGSDLTISLSSAIWSDSLPDLLSFLEGLEIRIQLMFDVSTMDGEHFVFTPDRRRSLRTVITRIQEVRDASKAPVDVHFCSIKQAGRTEPDVRLLDTICSDLVNAVSGDTIYSGGLQLDRDKLAVVAEAYPEIARWCIGNELLRHSPMRAMQELYAAEGRLGLYC